MKIHHGSSEIIRFTFISLLFGEALAPPRDKFILMTRRIAVIPFDECVDRYSTIREYDTLTLRVYFVHGSGFTYLLTWWFPWRKNVITNQPLSAAGFIQKRSMKTRNKHIM